ncbi:transcriptional regulator [Bosea sp. RAC05]|nr:transcriptional regulator [Bosea sp. RAC05]AOG03006.1 hypothetical protein BSY19_4858 [Bosea sp. RAC05]
MVIATHEDYQAALVRVAELAGALEDTPEDAELAALSEAVLAWEESHPEA